LLERRQQVIRNELYRAVDHGEYDKVAGLMQDMIDFSIKHPQLRTDVAGGLKGRAQERAIAGATGTGVLTTPHMLPVLQNYQFGVQR
jgi:hypothetical protein